jgi:hypothetical protein
MLSLYPIGWLWQVGQPADHMIMTWAAMGGGSGHNSYFNGRLNRI